MEPVKPSNLQEEAKKATQKKTLFSLVVVALITVITLVVIVVVAICKEGSTDQDVDTDDNTANSSQSNKDTNEVKDVFEIITDTYLKTDLKNALSEINAVEKKITQFKQIDDWAGGARYSFLYDKDIPLTVYCNMKSTVESINMLEIKIYYRGYEPYDIKDYLRDSSVISRLKSSTMTLVKTQLNYPSTASFDYSWSTGHNKDFYVLSNTVTAKNAFGVKSTYSFTARFYVTKNEEKCIYLNVGGSTIFNNTSQYKTNEERKTVTPKYPNKGETENISGINLVYNELGKYGKREIDDGISYIAYYVPSGKYTVINNGNMGTVFVMDPKDTDWRTYQFKKGSNGKTIEIEVPEGYHIELASSTNVILQEIEE